MKAILVVWGLLLGSAVGAFFWAIPQGTGFTGAFAYIPALFFWVLSLPVAIIHLIVVWRARTSIRPLGASWPLLVTIGVTFIVIAIGNSFRV